MSDLSLIGFYFNFENCCFENFVWMIGGVCARARVWIRFEESFVETRSINPDHNSFAGRKFKGLASNKFNFCETFFFYKLPSKQFLNYFYIERYLIIYFRIQLCSTSLVYLEYNNAQYIFTYINKKRTIT